MRKAIISFISIFLLAVICGCNEKPLVSSSDIHYFCVDTETGRCYTNTTGKYLYSENRQGEIVRNPFGRNIRDLSYSNGAVYYLDEWFEDSKHSYVLYRFDGTESTAVADAARYRVVGNTVFFINENKLYKSEDTDKAPQVVKSDIVFTDFDADSKYIYYADGESAVKKDICRLNHKNGKVERLREGANVYNFKVKDGFIYFTDMSGDRLYRLDIQDKTTEVIASQSDDYYIGDFLFSEGWIYFAKGQMRIKPD